MLIVNWSYMYIVLEYLNDMNNLHFIQLWSKIHKLISKEPNFVNLSPYKLCQVLCTNNI